MDSKPITPFEKGGIYHQCGTAIVVALFVVALVAAAATIMIERLRTDTRRTELILNSTNMGLYAQGSIIWAIDELNNNLKHQKPNQITDKTPIRSPVDHLNGAAISSVIYDAQGYFNINNLNDPKYEFAASFMHLLQTVAPEVDANNAQNITLAIVDWISNFQRNPQLDEYYLKSTPSYRAPHRPMISISELRLVKGVTPSLFAKLSPFLIALPKKTNININNATAPVLMILSPTLSYDSAKALEKVAQQTPFTGADKFLQNDIVKNNNIKDANITVKSDYFLVETNVTLGKQRLTLFTLLERSLQGNQPKTTILWQSKGTL